MKKYVFGFLFFFGVMGASAQTTLDGNWKGSHDGPDGSFEINYAFKIEGTKITGVCTTQFGELPIDNGKIDGKNFSFSISFNDTTLHNTGEILSDNEISIKNERGEMKLARVK